MGLCLVCGRDDVCDDCATFNRLDDGSGRSWYEVPLPIGEEDENAEGQGRQA